MVWHYRLRIHKLSGELIETVNFYRDYDYDDEQAYGLLFMRCGHHHSGVLEVFKQGGMRVFPYFRTYVWKGAD